MLSIPYCMEINDISLFIRKGYTGDQYFNPSSISSTHSIGQCEAAESARHSLHPMIAGQPLRSKISSAPWLT